MLSPSQKSVLGNRSKPDGSTASSQYVHGTRKAIKVKILEACEDLKLIAESGDEQLVNLVNACLTWHGPSNSKKNPESKPSPSSDWPDDPSTLPEYVPDKEKVFRSLNL